MARFAVRILPRPAADGAGARIAGSLALRFASARAQCGEARAGVAAGGGGASRARRCRQRRRAYPRRHAARAAQRAHCHAPPLTAMLGAGRSLGCARPARSAGQTDAGGRRDRRDQQRRPHQRGRIRAAAHHLRRAAFARCRRCWLTRLFPIPNAGRARLTRRESARHGALLINRSVGRDQLCRDDRRSCGGKTISTTGSGSYGDEKRCRVRWGLRRIRRSRQLAGVRSVPHRGLASRASAISAKLRQSLVGNTNDQCLAHGINAGGIRRFFDRCRLTDVARQHVPFWLADVGLFTIPARTHGVRFQAAIRRSRGRSRWFRC